MAAGHPRYIFSSLASLREKEWDRGQERVKMEEREGGREREKERGREREKGGKEEGRKGGKRGGKEGRKGGRKERREEGEVGSLLVILRHVPELR